MLKMKIMNRNRYMKSLWASLVIAWSCVVPLMGQTELPTAGGALNGKYILKKNTIITSNISVGDKSNELEIDLNGFVLSKAKGHILSVAGGKTLTIIDSNPTKTNTGNYGIGGAQVTIKGGVITGGTGDRGGAVHVGVEGKFYFEGGTIAGCKTIANNTYEANNINFPTNGGGGAVYLQQGAYMEMNGGHIAYCQTGNTSSIVDKNAKNPGFGGAVFVDSEDGKDAEFVFKSGSIYNCKASSGGAVYVHSPLDNSTAKGAKFTMSGGEISNCTAAYNVSGHGGGAVYLSSSATFEMSNGKISGNTAPSGGGVMMLGNSGFTMSGGEISNCTAAYNVSGHGGGAVYLSSSATFEMSNGKISGNTAPSGGGVMMLGNSGFTMSGGEISNCTATYDLENTGSDYWNYGGGAVYVSPESKFIMNDGVLSRNKTASYGNAVYVKGIFNMTNGTISGNIPYDWNGTDLPYKGTKKTIDNVDKNFGSVYGGGVFTYTETAKFTMSGGIISDNTAASGGGVMVWTGSTFEMNGGTITGNQAIGTGGLGNGGAVYVQEATFNFNKGILSYNKARRYGGAVNINQTAFLNLAEGECIIQGNTANHGGGLSQEAGNCTMTLNKGNQIINNHATPNTGLNSDDDEGHGGALFIEKGELTINDGVIINGNTATDKGGGVSLHVERIVGDITVNMAGGTISDNEAGDTGGGIDVYAQQSEVPENDVNEINVNIKGGTISSNKAKLGAGVHIGVNKENSVAYMVIGEEGKSVGPEILNNEASQNGGGFAMVNTGNTNKNMGKVTIHNGKFISNKANNGGGFFVENGEVEITTCDIKENIASEYGGGLYVQIGESVTDYQSVEFNGGNFIANTAKYGGGVALNGKIELTMKGNIENNLATNGGGLYLGKGGHIYFGVGLIRNNQATSTSKMEGVTAYGKTVSDVTGIGGGIFMDSDTKLEFTDNDELGLYGNIAVNGADDIFANGSGTSVHLPTVTDDPSTTTVNEGMKLIDFPVPVDSKYLFWVKDYITKDSGYENSPEGIGEDDLTKGNVRYRNAQTATDYWKLKEGTYVGTNKGYISVALGYRMLFATITKEGLVDGESAIFKVYRGNQTETPYASVLLTGDSSTGNAVSKRIALTEGLWTVKETGWTWNYSSKEPSNGEKTLTVEEKAEHQNLFKFVNARDNETHKKTTYD